MKKALGLLLAVGLLMAAMTTVALAATPGDGVRDFATTESQPGAGHAWGFADENGDGINDNFVDADGDGICDNFVDEDGDGVNDLRGTRGMGNGAGNGAGLCSGDNFVDADGDGVCDNAGSGGMGGGQRHMGGNGAGATG